MLLKIRYTRTIIYEAFVEIASGFGQYEIEQMASDIADEKDLWNETAEENSKVEIVAEYGKIPTIREDKS